MARFQIFQIDYRMVSGLGTEVKKVTQQITGETVAYIGKVNETRVIHFVKPVPLGDLSALVDDVLDVR